MDRISLKGMAFYGWHGVMEEEHALGQRFYVDVELALPLQKAAETDALADTVNYASVYGVVRQIMEQDRYALLERAAGEIITQILARFPLVERVVVTIHKPSAPVPGILEDVAVTVERGRHEP